MIEKIKALCVKHREILVYLIVGGLTTLVSWGCKFLWGATVYHGVTHPTVSQTTVLNVVENRILAEFGGFFVSRLGTWGLSLVLNLLLTNVLNVEYHIATVLVAVVVIVGNYVISKFLIFRKKKDGEESPAETEE